MTTFEEARRIILERAKVLGSERVPSLESVGRVLAADVVAPRDLPAWDNSAMDGYALRAGDANPGAALPISGYLPAGAPSAGALAPGTAAKIMTGAPLPAGADSVVPLEETEEREGSVLLRRSVAPGAHVRRRGEDVRAGEVILRAGVVLGPAEISALASCSKASVAVVRRPRVAIVSTGDELLEIGEALSPGKIYESNALSVAAAVRQIGAEPAILGIAPDDRDGLRRFLEEGLRADALVTTAGVSAGDRDLVREVLAELGAEQHFWKVEIKPGHPFAFSTCKDTLVFSLPGNPVSTLVTFEQFARPALLKMMGHRRILRRLVRALLRDGASHKRGRLYFLRVRLEEKEGALVAVSAGSQETSRLKTLLEADGLALIPAELDSVPPGAAVSVQVLRPDLELMPA